MHRPIIWITGAFAAGIALGRWTALSPFGWILVACASAVAALVFRGAGTAVIALLVACAATGALWYGLQSRPPVAGSVLEAVGREVAIRGTVVRPSLTSQGRTKAVVAVEHLATRGVKSSAHGLVLITLRGDHPLRYGDRIAVRGRLSRPALAGNPGEFSYRDYLATQGVAAVLYTRPDAPIRVVGRARMNPILLAAYALRERMIAFFNRVMPGARGSLMASLLLGDDGAITPEARDAFKRSGLLHVLVVSGAQVGLVLGSVMWLGRALRAPPTLNGVIAAIAVIFFSLMAGWVPSVARAALMAVVGVAALFWRRDRDPHAALALAALVLLASTPLLLFDAGFQLSFAATWGLLYVAPPLAERLSMLPRGIRTLLSLTVAAQLSVMPLLAYHFLQVSLIGLIANLVVVPLVAVLVPAGFLAAIAGLAAPALGSLLALPLHPLVDAVSGAAAAFSRAPLATVPVAPPSALAFVGFYGGLIGLVEWLRGRLRVTQRRALAVAAAIVAIAVWTQVVAAAAPPRLVLTFLDVGQGDAILVQAPSGRTVLIDGGGEVEGRTSGYDVGAQRVVPALRRLGVRCIDLIVLTHAHEDHVGGLVAVVQNFKVGAVLDSGYPHPAPSYSHFLRLVDAHKILYRLARRGMHLDLGNGVEAVVLSPEPPLITGSGSDVNLNSVVIRMTYGGVSVLFTGDIEALVESRLLEDGDELHSTVLKVAHHGSATSSTPAFLDAVAPAVAVISVGALNPFGHPHPATLEALEAVGAAVYRTDRHGAISIATDGRRLWIHTVRDESDR